MAKRERKKLVFCDVCNSPTKRPEYHHFTPRRAGGSDDSNNIIGLCIVCHDLIDRVPMDDLFPWICEQMAEEPAPRWAQILMFKQHAVFSDAKANKELLA